MLTVPTSRLAAMLHTYAVESGLAEVYICLPEYYRHYVLAAVAGHGPTVCVTCGATGTTACACMQVIQQLWMVVTMKQSEPDGR